MCGAAAEPRRAAHTAAKEGKPRGKSKRKSFPKDTKVIEDEVESKVSCIRVSSSAWMACVGPLLPWDIGQPPLAAAAFVVVVVHSDQKFSDDLTLLRRLRSTTYYPLLTLHYYDW